MLTILMKKGKPNGSVESVTKATEASAGSDYLRNTVFYSVVGILFTAFGASQLRWLGLQAGIYLMIGLALLRAARANYLEGRKYK